MKRRKSFVATAVLLAAQGKRGKELRIWGVSDDATASEGRSVRSSYMPQNREQEQPVNHFS
jgi:hypothetical protein